MTAPYPTKTLFEIRRDGYPDLLWKIHKLVPDRGITIFGGTSGAYKTWVAMQLALACASGEKFLEHFDAKKATVLYIDEENGDITLPNRFEQLIKGHDHKHDFNNLHVVQFANIKLDDGLVAGKLSYYIKQHDVRLIIFDSMIRCMNGEEDKSKDVRIVFDTLKTLLKEADDLSVILLHHTAKGKRGLEGLRGSGDFAAFADVVLMFQPARGNLVNVEIAKNRHIDLAKFSRFSIEVINTPEGGLSLAYSEYANAGGNINAVDSIKEDLLEYFKEEGLEEFRSGAIDSVMRKKGHTRSNCYTALNQLKEEGFISKGNKQGKWLVHQLQIAEEVIK